jgi:hypothetical protein
MHKKGFNLQHCRLRTLLGQVDKEFWGSPNSEDVINYFETGQIHPLVGTYRYSSDFCRLAWPRPDQFD